MVAQEQRGFTARRFSTFGRALHSGITPPPPRKAILLLHVSVLTFVALRLFAAMPEGQASDKPQGFEAGGDESTQKSISDRVRFKQEHFHVPLRKGPVDLHRFLLRPETRRLRWSCEGDAAAIDAKSGVFTPLTTGTLTVTVSSPSLWTKESNRIRLTVYTVQIKEIDGTDVQYLAKGQTKQVKAVVSPTPPPGGEYYWGVADEDYSVTFSNTRAQQPTITGNNETNAAVIGVAYYPPYQWDNGDTDQSPPFVVFSLMYDSTWLGGGPKKIIYDGQYTWTASLAPNTSAWYTGAVNFSFAVGQGTPNSASVPQSSGMLYHFASRPTGGQDLGVIRASLTLDGSTASCDAVARVVDVQPYAIEFSGSGKHTVSTDGGIAYSAPEQSNPNIYNELQTSKPLCYVRNNRPIATVMFRTFDYPFTDDYGTGNTANMPILGDLAIKGAGYSNGSGYNYPATATVKNDNSYFTATINCSRLLEDAVDWIEDWAAYWQVATQGTSSSYWRWGGIGKSDLYAVYNTPAFPQPAPGEPTPLLRESLLYIGCKAADGQTAENNVFSAYWAEFASRSVEDISQTVLKYYGDWEAQSIWYPDLLLYKDGQCHSWADLMVKVGCAQGLTDPGEVALVLPDYPYSAFFIKNWGFQLPGRNPEPDYAFINIPDAVYPPSGPPVELLIYDNSYHWALNDCYDVLGTPGQGTSNPVSLFGCHYLVERGGTYYDPSYGAQYASKAAFRSLATYQSERGYTELNEADWNIDFNKNDSMLDTLNVPTYSLNN